jgi:hypothetical protein
MSNSDNKPEVPNVPKIISVEINSGRWVYQFADEKMTLGQSYLDGPDLIFVKE